MSFQECVRFANEQRVAYFATSEDGQPHVRPLGMWFADDQGFYFQAVSVKALYKQLEKNKRVEMCFYDPNAEKPLGKVLRVKGEVEFLEDAELKKKALEDRPFLKDMGIESPEDPRLVVFRVHTGEAFFWTMKDSMRESEIERIRF